MKRRILASIIVVVALVALYLVVALIARFWPIVCGLFWTLTFAVGLFYGAFRLAEWIRDSYYPRRFHPRWALLPAMLVFLIVWGYGYDVTMLGWRMKPIEAEFLTHANNDPCTIEGGQMNYHGSLDPILAERDTLLRRYHAKMVGNWWTDTDNGARINAYYEWDPLWWWSHKEHSSKQDAFGRPVSA
jgi:hypothetical protein